jgi:hypothetical protein
MDNQYVEITPELLDKTDPDQQWIERELDRINPWRHEQGADGADTAALRQLVLELRDKGRSDAQPDNGGPAFPAMEVRTHDTGDLVENASQGMTMRDYFAAKASEEDINEHIWKGYKEEYVDDDGRGTKSIRKRQAMWTREEARYRYADAMLKARAS